MRKIQETGAGFVEGTTPLSSTEGKVTLADIQNLQASIDALAAAINGNLSFGDGTPSSRGGNFDAQLIEFVSPFVVNTPIAVPHGLKRRPWGFIDVFCMENPGGGASGIVSAAQLGSWSDTFAYFSCNQSSRRKKILIF